MKVFLGKNAGFCSGVSNAVKMAEEALAQYGRVYSYGRIIHNDGVVEKLKYKGLVSISEIDNLKGEVVLIRAHGVTRETIEKLRANGNRIIDATCPSVRRIHQKVEEYSANGYGIIIFGDKNHAEVKGTAGYAERVVITDDSDEFIIPAYIDKWFVVAQTTANSHRYGVFRKKLVKQAKNNSKIVEFLDSICYTTQCRQIESVAIAKKCDTVLVVGDNSSSNTKELAASAGKYCKNVYLITNVSDLESVTDKKTITMLGIIAGASTPKELIMEVINRMDQENKVDTIVEEVVTNNETAAVAAPEAPVAQATAEPAKASNEDMTMDEGMKKYGLRTYREGMKCKAFIISVEPTGVSVSVPGLSKNDSGFIAGSEMELDGTYNPADYKVGEEIDAIIIPKTDPKMKAINLSKRKLDEIKVEDEAVKKILQGEEFVLACDQAVKGGLLGRLGTYTIFVPASHIRMGFVKNLEEYVGKKLRLRILPPKEEAPAEGEEETRRKPNPKRIIASQRVILEEEKVQHEAEFWDMMQVNNIVKGKVRRFTEYAAFVSVMNHDCFAHISDLSWTKINHPSEVLEIGKSYDFVVIKVDRENERVSLGYKQLQKKPYELAAEKYHVGDVITGKVQRIKDFGAFIELEPGIDGLVHVSEIAHKYINSAAEVLKIGDEITAKIIGFENNKITLSMKALIEAPVFEAPVESEEAEGAETEGAEKPNRIAKFNRRSDAADKGEKKERRPRRGDKPEDDGEPHEYVSEGNVNPTLADLFKNIDIKFEEDK